MYTLYQVMPTAHAYNFPVYCYSSTYLRIAVHIPVRLMAKRVALNGRTDPTPRNHSGTQNVVSKIIRGAVETAAFGSFFCVCAFVARFLISEDTDEL